MLAVVRHEPAFDRLAEQLQGPPGREILGRCSRAAAGGAPRAGSWFFFPFEFLEMKPRTAGALGPSSGRDSRWYLVSSEGRDSLVRETPAEFVPRGGDDPRGICPIADPRVPPLPPRPGAFCASFGGRNAVPLGIDDEPLAEARISPVR